MALETGLSPADIGAIMKDGGDGFGNNGAWWIIILFLFVMMGGWGNNWNNGAGGVTENYVLNSDFSQLSRQLDQGVDRLASQGVQIANGLCDGFYTQAQLVNGVQMTQMQNAKDLQAQLASCCCDTRSAIDGLNYNMAMNTNALQSAINTGFCQTNFNNQNNTRDIIDAQNCNTRAILEALNANRIEQLQNKIADQNQQINALQLSASQWAQNQYLISQLKITT